MVIFILRVLCRVVVVWVVAGTGTLQVALVIVLVVICELSVLLGGGLDWLCGISAICDVLVAIGLLTFRRVLLSMGVSRVLLLPPSCIALRRPWRGWQRCIRKVGQPASKVL